MPLSQLLEYKGRNPKPDDFDAFWDASLAEMHAIDPSVSLSAASFQVRNVECFDLTFTGVRGANIYAKHLRPAHADGPLPAILHFHGYTWRSSDWAEYLGWVAAGFAVFALDCRGQAGKSEDPGGVTGNTHSGHIIRGLDDSPSKLLYRDIFLDTAQLARIAMEMPEIDASRVAARGGSQGGALTLACAALEPRVARAVPEFPFLCDYLRVWEMDLCRGAYGEIKTFFRHFDPLHEREAEIFRRLGYIDVQHLAPRIQAHTLMAVGLMDETTPPSTCFAAYNKITAKKDVVIYPDFAHEGLHGFGDKAIQFLCEM